MHGQARERARRHAHIIRHVKTHKATSTDTTHTHALAHVSALAHAQMMHARNYTWRALVGTPCSPQKHSTIPGWWIPSAEAYASACLGGASRGKCRCIGRRNESEGLGTNRGCAHLSTGTPKSVSLPEPRSHGHPSDVMSRRGNAPQQMRRAPVASGDITRPPVTSADARRPMCGETDD